ncbi:zinc finger protein 39 isoform X2 [Cherax quadricarinatus]|uniref:zinc finger protein 39 isoform X2 n=1 Tax=Cherax quadricarinatus TaxID=27406 RepID=UPI00387E8692
MSNSLSSFLVRSSSQAAIPFEGETSCSPLSAGAFLTGLTTSPHVSTSFLTATSQTSDSAFLTSQAGTSKTFLSLSESSETAETFLSSTEGDVSTAEEVLLSRNVGEYEEVAQGPMLYLVPATGLHVLVHHLPHSTQESTGPQLPGDDSSQEQFVVVGALQSEEEQVIMEGSLTEHPPGNTSHISVENMLTSHIVAAESTSTAALTTNQLFDSQLESSLDLNTEVVASDSSNSSHKDNGNGNTLLNLHGTVGTVEDPKGSPLLMDCSGTPMLTLQVPDENSEVNSGEIRRDLLDIESAPHINLEEIIEKFAGSSNHHEVIDNASSSTISDHIETTILSTSENSAELTNITAFKEESLLKKRSPLEPHIHIVSEPPIQSSCSVKSLTSFTSRSNQRSNIPGKFQNDHDELSFDKNKFSKFDANDPMAIDEESLYDIVMTYRCKICSEVFFEKSGLLEHYQDIHKPGGVIKIRVTTSNNSISSLHYAASKLPYKKACFETPASNIILKEASNNRREAPKELNILSCGFCSENFVGHQQYQEHINKEYPRETERKPKKGSYSHRYSQGVQTAYPLQPGMLIGHRKSRTYNQEEIEENKSDNTENRKRRVRAPKNLQEQYWLHKQKPKPVFSKEVERTFKCSLRTCKYKFSSEDNLNQHQQCHGQPGSGEERVFTCHRCFLKYDKWSMCQLHLWKAHGIDIDLFTCGICQTYKTCTQQRLVIHQKTHSDTRDHICKVCGKGFRQLAQLLNHQVLHITNAKNLPSWAQKGYCNECKRWFWDKKSLKIHISAVHLKLKPHACPHCSYRCSRKFDLKVHQRQHTGEQPHKCELCGWQGRDHNALRRHKLIHLHLKPLKCPHDFCLYESCHSAYFRRHIAKKHPKAEDIYKCQVCSMETPILQDYITHSTNHMKQLVKDAFKKRSDSLDIKKDIESSDAEKIKLESKDKDNFKMEKHKQGEDSSTVQDINSESVVFDSVSNSEAC